MLYMMLGCILHNDLYGDSDRPLDPGNFTAEDDRGVSLGVGTDSDTSNGYASDSQENLTVSVDNKIVHVAHYITLGELVQEEDVSIAFDDSNPFWIIVTYNVDTSVDTGGGVDQTISFDIDLTTYDTGEYTLEAHTDSTTFVLE